MAVLQQIWFYEIIGGTLPMCHNTTMRVIGAWIKIYCILCSETYTTLHSCHNFPAGSREAARDAHIFETSLLDPHKTVGVITHPCPETWMSNCIPLFYVHVII